MYELLQHPHKDMALTRLERCQYQPLRGLNGGLDVDEQATAQWRDGKRFR